MPVGRATLGAMVHCEEGGDGFRSEGSATMALGTLRRAKPLITARAKGRVYQ